MIISSKTEFLLYCLFDTLDVLSRPTAAYYSLYHDGPDLHWMSRKRGKYLVGRGLMATEMDAQRRRLYRLTNAGAICALGGRDPREGWESKWDGRWRLVIYDIPETDRKFRLMLRRELSQSGFGCLQKSVWVSPHPADPLKRKLAKLKIDISLVTVLDVLEDEADASTRIVERAWDFNGISTLYKIHDDHLKSVPDRSSQLPLIKQWALMEQSLWRDVLRCDPFLPDCLLPRKYPGKRAWKKRLRVLRDFGPVIKRLLEADVPRRKTPERDRGKRARS